MFTGNENHDITFQAAGILTKNYRDQMGTDDKKGGFFGKVAIQKLLDQKDCVGIRYYYALDSNGDQTLVMVGVDENEDDLIGSTYACIDMSEPCPEHCSVANVLNS